jgi:hypothetical protein
MHGAGPLGAVCQVRSGPGGGLTSRSPRADGGERPVIAARSTVNAVSPTLPPAECPVPGGPGKRQDGARNSPQHRPDRR